MRLRWWRCSGKICPHLALSRRNLQYGSRNERMWLLLICQALWQTPWNKQINSSIPISTASSASCAPCQSPAESASVSCRPTAEDAYEGKHWPRTPYWFSPTTHPVHYGVGLRGDRPSQQVCSSASKAHDAIIGWLTCVQQGHSRPGVVVAQLQYCCLSFTFCCSNANSVWHPVWEVKYY